MTISVQEALLLPVMERAKLLAGKKGIENQIKWVTIVEVIEDISRFQQGEFLITTGYGLSEHSTHFCELLRSQTLSGIAFYSGFYLKRIPSIFLEIAEEVGLPFIELPTDINFSHITKGILEEILNKQMKMTMFSLETHKHLTQLVLKNDGPKNISTTLSELIGSSIFVLNEFDEITYEVFREKSLRLKEKQFFYKNRQLDIMEYVKDCREKGSSREMVWAVFKIMIHPIIANEKFYGSLVIFSKKDEWQEIYRNAIEHGATVFAIEFLKDEAVRQTQMRLQGEFLEEVINKHHQASPILLDRGKAFGYNLSVHQAVLQLKLDGYEDRNTNKDVIEQLYNTCTQVMSLNERQFMISTKLDGLTILFEVKALKKLSLKGDSLNIASQIMKKWEIHNRWFPLIIGVGKVYKDPQKLSGSANEAKYAVDLSHLLLSKKNVIHYDDLATYHLLIQMKEMGLSLQAFYENQLEGLFLTKNQGTDYIETLEYYFKNNLNMQATAQSLYIHRHTLKYRLTQIERRSGYDLSSADDRLKLQLAIAAYKLDNYFNG